MLPTGHLTGEFGSNRAMIGGVNSTTRAPEEAQDDFDAMMANDEELNMSG